MAGIPLSRETFIKKIYSTIFEPESIADLVLIVVWLTASVLTIYHPMLNAKPVRYLLTIPFVLIIPGYSLMAALFPRVSDLTLLERIALSIGLSVAFIPLIGLGLNFTPWGIRRDPILITLTLFTLVMVIIAFFRRALITPEKRFRLPFSAIIGIIHQGIFPADSSRINRLLSRILVCVIIIAIIATAYVIAYPKEGEHFSEFYILGEKGMAADYPEQIIAGLDYPIFIGVGNHEYRTITYTIETWTMHTDFDSMTNISSIIEMDPVDHQSIVLSHNETVRIPYNLSVQKTEYNRVEFLLFNETVPGLDVQGNDRINASYRQLNLWITVR